MASLGKRQAWILYATITGVCLLASDVDCCGIILHTEIGERASQYFSLISEGVDYSLLLRRHPDAFQAGSPYPDAYYNGLCYDGIYGQVSEDSHWTPFLNATVNYIRRVYPKPWDLYTEKLVVFLFGIVTHQVADINWHSLGIEQGFLDTMGKLNYHGSFSDAHSDGDVGADILNLFETDTSYIGVVTKWYVPVDDLVKIYEELYGQPDRMKREVIENCTMILFLGRLGESLGVLELLYPALARNSPFILDRLSDYFLGGTDDMAVWSGNVWKRTVTMLDKGTSACDLPNNPIYIRCNGTKVSKDYRRKFNSPVKNASPRTDGANQDLWNLNENDVSIQRTHRGIYLSAAEPIQQLILKKLQSVEPYLCNGTCETPLAYYTTEQSYSRLGRCIVSGDVNGDGFVDVLISAPGFSSPGSYQEGRVYIIYGSASGIPDTNAVIETVADLVLTGQQMNGRFGASVALIDFNADGLSDVAVGAPSVGSETLDYNGQVYIYLNSELTGIPSVPSITIDCTERYCNFGWVLESSDFNGDGFHDLIIGSPFAPSGGSERGLVGVFFASPTYQEGAHLTEVDFDWKYAGQQDYEWLGFSLSGGKINSESWLLVGAPTYRKCSRPGCEYVSTDVQSVGRVYVFHSLALIQLLEGQDEFEQFGFSVKVAVWNGIDVAILSSASGDLQNDNATGNAAVQMGVVRVFPMSPGGVQPQTLFVMQGDREFSRFGSTVLVYDSPVNGKSTLLVTAPYRSEDLRTDRESGKVFLYENVTLGVSEQQEADRIFGMSEDKARFGSSVAFVPSQNKMQLVVGAEHYTYRTRLGGAVGVFVL